MLGAVFYLMGWLPKVDAGRLALFVRKLSPALFVFAGALVVTRNIGAAMLGAMLTYSFMQKTGWIPGGGGKRTTSGSVSTVRTPFLEMSLDHATGAMSGRLLQGRFAGRALSDFTAAERLDCLAELRGNDSQAAQLFEAYFDRTAPGWNASARAGGQRAGGPSRGMGVEEAYLVLGLDPGATRVQVQAAHRNLMKRYHPDQGGSTYIAAKVNEAKDVLLKHIRV